MKILFIITRADTIGGAQVHVRDLSKALIEDGHEVLVVVGSSGPYTDELLLNQIPFQTCSSLFRSIKPIQDLKSLRFINRTIKEFQPDLIVAHSSKAGILGRAVAKFNQIPCIFTAHGWAFTEGVSQPTRALYKVIERFFSSLADRIICVSDYDRQIGIKAGIKSSCLKTIYNGMPDISPSLRAHPGDHNDKVNIIMIARFDHQKDHSTLIRAFQGVPDAELTLVGDGPRLHTVKALVDELRLSQKVNFLGFRKDIPQILSHAHIFTLISHWEGLPLTIIEAMRSGLPVITSKVGGAAETIVEGISGFAVPRSEVDILRGHLNRLVMDAQLRIQMGKAARQRYEQLFTFERMFSETYQTYEFVLHQRKSN